MRFTTCAKCSAQSYTMWTKWFEEYGFGAMVCRCGNYYFTDENNELLGGIPAVNCTELLAECPFYES